MRSRTSAGTSSACAVLTETVTVSVSQDASFSVVVFPVGGTSPAAGCLAPARCYAGIVTPEELANLAHLRRARDLIDREYARPLDVAALARAALMSAGHFSRQFRAAYGETPYAYLMTRRIERAKALLRRGDLSVTEVCMAVGCTSLGSFSARFTELVGETPTAYRARDHGALAGVPGCIARDLTRPSRRPDRIEKARGALAP
jgi:AraC-like DNA-binding protein